MEDTKVATLGVNIDLDDDTLWLVLHTGIVLPFGPPGGPAIPVPTKVYRFPFNKEAAETTAAAMTEGASMLPDTPKPSDLVVAKSMAGVDDVVKAHQSFRDGK